VDQINGFFAIAHAKQRMPEEGIIVFIEGFQETCFLVFRVVCLPNIRHVKTIIREDGLNTEIFHTFPQVKKAVTCGDRLFDPHPLKYP
jgi:hypothetical protein